MTRTTYGKLFRNDEPNLRRFRKILWKTVLLFSAVAVLLCLTGEPPVSSSWTDLGPLITFLFTMTVILFLTTIAALVVLIAIYVVLCHVEDAVPGAVGDGLEAVVLCKKITKAYLTRVVKPSVGRLSFIIAVIGAEFALAFSGLLPVPLGYKGAWLVSSGIAVTGLIWVWRTLAEGAARPQLRKRI